MGGLTRVGKSYEQENPWPALIMAILAVNNFSLAKVLGLFEGLDANSLFDPENLAGWDLVEVARRLKAAGYDRGPWLTNMLAERLSSLRAIVNNVTASESVLAHGSKREVKALLKCVNGVGPMVVDNFLLLRG